MKKIALITGSAKRIGKEIAFHLAKNGWNIVVHYNHSRLEANKLCKKINNFSHSIAIKSNFINMREYKTFFVKIFDRIGVPSLLINNASLFEDDNIHNITHQKLQQHMNVNCFAPILLAHEFANIKIRDKNIINIIDYEIGKAKKTFLSYSLSKLCLLHATQCLALQLTDKCRVNAISPSYVLKATYQSEEQFRQMVKEIH